MWCDNEEACPNGPYEMSYPKTIAEEIGRTGDFSCVAYVLHVLWKNCLPEFDTDYRRGGDCDIPTDEDQCANSVYSRYTFALKACKNLHDHLNKVIDTLASGQRSYASSQVYYVQDYSTDDPEVSRQLRLGSQQPKTVSSNAIHTNRTQPLVRSELFSPVSLELFLAL